MAEMAAQKLMEEKPKESDLYSPVKRLFESRGYEVKGEVGAADIVAVRGDEPPIIVELKTAFSLALVHQAIDRLKISDYVYLGVPEWKGRVGWKAFAANKTLCRRLGLGLITVKPNFSQADIHLDPGPYAPRQSKKRKVHLLKEFHHRVGDPNQGGINKTTIVTAYRQDAMRCLSVLGVNGPSKAALVAKSCAVSRARSIMADDHYGWFEKVDRGIYGLTPKGSAVLEELKLEIEALK